MALGHHRTILVTGGAGFIGSNFVLDVIETSGVTVVNLDALTYAGNLENLAALGDDPRHVFVHGSITDRPLLDRLLAEHQPSAIVNFAAESHVDRSIDSPGDFIDTNIVGTFHLLEATRKHLHGLDAGTRALFRFLHVSTDEVYGSLGPDGYFTETTPYCPNSPYSASKASADHLVHAYGHTFGLPVLMTNCSNNYGPYQFPEKLIPLIISNCLNNKPLPIYGDGLQVRDWLYVTDHCRAIQRVLEMADSGEQYNIGGNNEKTNISVVQTICEHLDVLAPRADGQAHASAITYVQDRPGHDVRYAIDASKIRRELDWEPAETFDSGIEKTVRWYLDNRAWCERILSGEYRGQRLGLGVDD
jgi:dTDP-glucose 4,6-dehydratase